MEKLKKKKVTQDQMTDLFLDLHKGHSAVTESHAFWAGTWNNSLDIISCWSWAGARTTVDNSRPQRHAEKRTQR